MTNAADAGLRREIGLFDATMIVISGIIGGGIFFTPAVVAQHLPSAEWIIAAWLAGAVVAFAGALTFAELASRFPEAGGHYVYIREAFGGLWAFLYGWMLLLIIATGALASLALAFAGYLGGFFSLSPFAQKGAAILIIIALSAINIIGVKPGTRTTNALTVIKVAAFAAIIGFGLLAEPTGALHFTGVQPQMGLAAFGMALVHVLFSYGGWLQLNLLA